MDAAFIFVFLVLLMGWQTVGAQEMLDCLIIVLEGTFRKKNGVSVSQKTMC